MQLAKNNIQPIFAVTENVEIVYKVNNINFYFLFLYVFLFIYVERIIFIFWSLCFLILFQQLQQMIPNSEVGVLSKNSDNVVRLIQEAYHVCSQFTMGKFCYLSPLMYACFSLKLHFMTNTLFLILKYLIHDRNCPQK